MSGEPGRLCLLDGRIQPFGEARISPLDRGFLFGDSVYEAVKALGGRLLFLGRHLERLAASLAALRMPPADDLAPRLEELVAANRLGDGVLYLQVTRGVARRRTHLPPAGLAPTVFAMTTEIAFPERPESAPGLAAVSRADDRWAHCDIKTTALAAGVLGKLAAADAGAAEALYTGAGGEIHEGGNTSFFACDEDGWHTHPAGAHVLPGITRGVLLEEAARFGVAIAERAPRLAARDSWRETFVCGTVTGVRAVVELDGAPVGDGAVGEGTRRFARWLAAAELAEARGAEENPA